MLCIRTRLYWLRKNAGLKKKAALSGFYETAVEFKGFFMFLHS